MLLSPVASSRRDNTPARRKQPQGTPRRRSAVCQPTPTERMIPPGQIGTDDRPGMADSSRGSGMTRRLTVAVIGHVNHGKTALVRALTGMETDRLKEEIERGLSITLGFAWRGYPSGAIDFIDSPGHEDFIGAMAAGATGARAVLLVVSAAEGFGPQTREHVQIAGLLGIAAGLVAVTKADLLSPAEETRVRADVEGALAG